MNENKIIDAIVEILNKNNAKIVAITSGDADSFYGFALEYENKKYHLGGEINETTKIGK